MMKRLSLLLNLIWGLSLCSPVFGQEKGIPTKYMNDPAVDLVYRGNVLFPEEVHELYESSKGKFDISNLNPIETSDLWKNVYPGKLQDESSKINEMDEVTYHSPVLSPSGIFRFNILNKNGENKFYTMMLSKTVHTALLAKSILRKIGYTVPNIKYLPKIVLKFKSESEKKSFISYLENVAYAGSHKNWMVEDLGDKLILQDLVVMESNHLIYNLAFGVTPEMIQGRRLLSSLAVPLSIVNLTESVNMFRWNAGIIANGRISLFHDHLEDFQCTWDDGRWAAKRIEKLTREDWEEIVASSQTPKPVQQILVEKLISRRNSVMKLFKVDAKEMKIDGKVNNGVELVDGKLTQERWAGYASRFAFGDPDSPLSDSDMKAWIKSRALSTAMELAVSQINQLPYLGTDVEALHTEKFEKHLADALAKAIQEQKPLEMPLKSWTVPTMRGNLLFARNLVTGTYLGTDNLVQLVDTVGVAVSGGLAIGTMGVSAGITPINVAGGLQGSLMRSYAHLRPVTNIRRSLKYPFKNILVPLVKHEYGKKLHEASMVVLDPEVSENERAEKIQAALKPFKDALNIGESLIVTDSLSTGLGIAAGANLYAKLLSISLGVQPGHIVVNRFHIHRKTEDDFQIYKDIGHKGSIGLNMSLDSLIPVLKVSFKKSRGNAKVKFYSLNLGPKNPDVLRNISALRRAVVHSSTAELDESGLKFYTLKHSFKEKNPHTNLLFWQFIKQNSSTQMSLKNPLGEEKYFRRHYYGSTKGRNYQAYVNGLIEHWVNLLFDKNAGLSDATGTNPGYSFKGRAQTKFLTLDEELDKDGNVIEPFISLSRVHNGWSVDRKKAEEILEEMRQRYKFQFFNAPVLNDTRRIFLYNISVSMLFYGKGIEYLLNLSDEEIKKIFLEHQSQDSLANNPSSLDGKKIDEEIYTETGVNKFLRLLKRYRHYILKGKTALANKYLLKAFSFLEKRLYVSGITELVGGTENFYLTSKITGFREGDEDGDRPITSSSLGEFGSPRILGPVVEAQNKTYMLEGEFFINWLMQRLI